jgi:hypothetical protein
MGDYRVSLQAAFTVSKRRNAESTRDAVIKMIRGSGFDEKEYVIAIDRTELTEGLKKSFEQIITKPAATEEVKEKHAERKKSTYVSRKKETRTRKKTRNTK